jgi:hypothetical protein
MAKRPRMQSPDQSAERDQLSTRLLALAQPLFDVAAPDPTPAQARTLMQIVVSVWNADVLGRWGITGDAVAAHRRVLDAAPPALASIIAMLFARKQELWPDELRAVGDWEVRTGPDGDWALHVEGRARPRS